MCEQSATSDLGSIGRSSGATPARLMSDSRGGYTLRHTRKSGSRSQYSSLKHRRRAVHSCQTPRNEEKATHEASHVAYILTISEATEWNIVGDGLARFRGVGTAVQDIGEPESTRQLKSAKRHRKSHGCSANGGRAAIVSAAARHAWWQSAQRVEADRWRILDGHGLRIQFDFSCDAVREPPHRRRADDRRF